MQLASDADIPEIRRFLLRYAATSMFPLSNLDRHGANGGHPRAVRFWVDRQAGQITDVLTVSDEGMVFPQCPNGRWGDVADVLRETGAKGIIGAADAVQAVRNAAGLAHAAGLDAVEPHYHLNLMDMMIPDAPNHRLISLAQAPRDLITAWRRVFCEEAMNFPHAQSGAKAKQDISAYLAQDTHRVLLDDGEPVAMTGFNAELPQIVQIGGVFTPPEKRGRGYARSAVALHLQQARAKGVAEAVLSAATSAAARAYEAIGFRKIGEFTILSWADRQVVNV